MYENYDNFVSGLYEYNYEILQDFPKFLRDEILDIITCMDINVLDKGEFKAMAINNNLRLLYRTYIKQYKTSIKE